MTRWLAVLALFVPLAAQAPVARPKILGVAHMAVFVSDLQKARSFYQGLLGYEEPFTLPKEDGSIDIAFVKINDRQWIELFNRPTEGEGQLSHIAIYTDDADRMRDYLASRDVKVPEKVGKGRTGNKNFTVRDPDGHAVEIVEYQPDSWTARDRGLHVPASRIADRALHVGILVGSLDASMKFYNGILGFEEFWRGAAANSPTLSWVNMRVPDGSDYIELMLYGEKPAADNRGSAHHICLVVPDADKAVAALEARPARAGYTRQMAVRTGINRKRQVNLFDPDGTRVELMEPDTVDGKPAPASTLPPPR
ncbi:MAG TPA: VOC family protein [Vicinamibacterales bacterium]|jgi:lactoylglutathione lyase